MPKFKLTGRDDYGLRVVVETENHSAAVDLMAFWKEAGFADVRLMSAEVRRYPDMSGPPESGREASAQ
jgi:hypothetical protein